MIDGGPSFVAAEQIEYEVFAAVGFCAVSHSGRASEYDPWRESSSFHVAFAPDGSIAGVIRSITGDYSELPVGTFERSVAYPLDPVTEFASLAVTTQWRGQMGVAETLYRDTWSVAVRRGAKGMVAIGENWLVELLNIGFDFGFVKLGETRTYMGGECFPMGVSLSDIARRLSERQPLFWQWCIEGLDLRDRPAAAARVIDLTEGAVASEVDESATQN